MAVVMVIHQAPLIYALLVAERLISEQQVILIMVVLLLLAVVVEVHLIMPLIIFQEARVVVLLVRAGVDIIVAILTGQADQQLQQAPLIMAPATPIVRHMVLWLRLELEALLLHLAVSLEVAVAGMVEAMLEELVLVVVLVMFILVLLILITLIIVLQVLLIILLLLQLLQVILLLLTIQALRSLDIAAMVLVELQQYLLQMFGLILRLQFLLLLIRNRLLVQ